MESMMMILILFVLMYFMMIRPESKRKKKVEEMRNSLGKGDLVTSIGGIVGKVVFIDDSSVVIETSEDRVRIQLAKWAIQALEQRANGEIPPEKQPKAAPFGFGKKKAEKTSDEVPEEPVAAEYVAEETVAEAESPAHETEET